MLDLVLTVFLTFIGLVALAVGIASWVFDPSSYGVGLFVMGTVAAVLLGAARYLWGTRERPY